MAAFYLLVLIAIGFAGFIFIKRLSLPRYRIVLSTLHLLVAAWLYGDGQLALKTYGFGIDREPVYPVFYICCAIAAYGVLSIPLIVYKRSKKAAAINLSILIAAALVMYFVALLA